MNKKKVGGFFAALAGIAAAIVASRGGGSKPAPNPSDTPPPVTAPIGYLAVWVQDGTRPVPGASVVVQGLPDLPGTTNADGWSGVAARFGPYTVTVSADNYQPLTQAITVDGHTDVHLSLTPLFVALPPLATDGPIFTAGIRGPPWRWKGVSAFALLDRFAKGEDISDFLNAYRGYNLLRVWPYVTWNPGGWASPSADVVRAFLARVARDGFYVELTLLTDDDPARLQPARELVAALARDPRPTNLVLEAGNEPETHKSIDTAALIPALDASGFLYATGNYEDSAKMRGSFGVTHTPRDGDWPRRAHDLLEFFHGGGPSTPSDPAHRFPIVADEPAKPQDVGGDHAIDWRSYFGTVSLLGAGGTFHCETCKFGRPPTAEERQLAAIALEALNAFPADAPKGAYRRPDDASLRTYAVGGFMVRVRPTTLNAPEPGWRSLEPSGVLWAR